MANIAEKWLFLQDLFPKQNNDMAYKENYPSKLLEDAVDAISSLPGVGRRSALRLALHLLRQPQENVHHFTSAIKAVCCSYFRQLLAMRTHVIHHFPITVFYL